MNATDENMLTFERTINAPRTLVWQAWTDPKHASQWWGLPGCTVHAFEADLQPGGAFRIDIEYGGKMTRIEGTYEDVVEFERLITVGTLSTDGVKLMDSRRTVDFEDDGAKTKIKLRQTFYNVTPEGAGAAAGASAGMKPYFDRLEAHVATMSR